MLKKTLGTSLYNNRETYETLLLQSHSASIHQRHLNFFMTEIYKSISKISLELKWLYFTYYELPLLIADIWYTDIQLLCNLYRVYF